MRSISMRKIAPQQTEIPLVERLNGASHISHPLTTFDQSDFKFRMVVPNEVKPGTEEGFEKKSLPGNAGHAFDTRLGCKWNLHEVKAMLK